MNQVSNVEKTTRRPGGRTAEVTQRVHEAVTALVLEGGTEACTFQAVADRAGVERSTLYRRYPDRWDMMIDVWMARAEEDVMPDLGATFADDLKSILRRLVDTLESPLGPVVLSVAAGLRARALGDYSRVYFDRRMEQLEPMFAAAIERGELPPDVDREALFAFTAGPVYFRMFIAGRPADERFIETLVEKTCATFCRPCR